MKETLSFVFCTDSAQHLQKFAEGLIPLSSLMNDTKMELVVVTPAAIDFSDAELQSFGIQVVFCRSPWGNRNTSRNSGYQVASGSWVYFIDHDVRFPDENLSLFAQALRNRIECPKDIWLLSGPYRSSIFTSFWGRVYNELSNAWLENPTQPFRFLAGNLLMRKQSSWRTPFAENLLNGGEEIEMAEQIQARGGKTLFCPELAVLHLAEHNLSLFWKRLQGHLSFKRKSTGTLHRTRLNFRVMWNLLKKPIVWPGLLIYVGALFFDKLRTA